MDGIINILKAPDMTSFDAVAQIRRLLREKKVGHTGTLDPDAVGVLPICLGKATRMVELLVDDHKFYRGEITLGIETDTQDSTGTVVQRRETDGVTRECVIEALASLTGRILQVPPMVSALKHQGKRLYELARAGIEVEREPREVEIFSLKILRIDLPKIWIDIECSKGTYIRTLAHDCGQALGTGAHLSYLIRTGTGQFTLENSVTLAELQQAVIENRVGQYLLPLDFGISSMPKVLVHRLAEKKAINGAQLKRKDFLQYPQSLRQGERARLYTAMGFVAIVEVLDPKEGIMQPVKVFA